MSVFDGIADLISSTISDLGLGKSVTHVSKGDGAGYNTATGKAQPSEKQTTITAVVDALTRELLQGVAVRSGDLRLVVASAEFTTAPKAGDEIVMDSDTYDVLAVKPVMGGSEVLTYELHCRR